MEKIKEAKVVEETILVKPEFKGEIKANIKTIGEIEDNIQDFKEYALNLKKYYSDITFTVKEKEDAEEQKAQINKQKSKIEEFRKQIVAKYNEPIKLFEETAKDTEKILKATYDLINEQVKAFNNHELEKIKEKVERFFNEYALSKEIDFVDLSRLNVSITKGLLTSTGNLTKKIQEQITDFIDRVRKDLDLIKTLEFNEEILIEYKKTLQCADSIALVQERHKQLEEIQQQKEAEKEQKLTDETMLNKIDECLKAPKVEKVEEKRGNMTFTILDETVERMKAVKQFLDNGGYRYE